MRILNVEATPLSQPSQPPLACAAAAWPMPGSPVCGNKTRPVDLSAWQRLAQRAACCVRRSFEFRSALFALFTLCSLLEGRLATGDWRATRDW
jgi:hypothetical protein